MCLNIIRINIHLVLTYDEFNVVTIALTIAVKQRQKMSLVDLIEVIQAGGDIVEGQFENADEDASSYVEWFKGNPTVEETHLGREACHLEREACHLGREACHLEAPVAAAGAETAVDMAGIADDDVLHSNPQFSVDFDFKLPDCRNACRRRILKFERYRYVGKLSKNFCLKFAGVNQGDFSCKEEKFEYNRQMVIQLVSLLYHHDRNTFFSLFFLSVLGGKV